MSDAGIKRYLPRSLYARAALILVLPILTLQIVVSVVFIQRHYEGVTEQLSRSIAGELRLILTELSEAPDLATARLRAAELSETLDVVLTLPAEPLAGDRRRFWDLPGRVVIEVLQDRVDGIAAIDLVAVPRAALMTLATPYGPAELEVARRRVSVSAPHQVLVLMVVTGLLMTVVAYLFLRNQLRPIKRLADAAQAFGKGRVEPYRPRGAREVRAAGMAFLDMRARIERQIEQRTMMLSAVSHDLRTPLTRLRLALSLMDDREAADMLNDVGDMERLVDEFLRFARGEALDDPVPVDAAALVRGVLDDAGRAGQPVSAGRIDETGAVPLRPMAITRALENLIGNAVRHGDRAWVGLHGLERSIRFSVEDDGPGIPAARRGEALKPFARLDPARGRQAGSGAGLGLAIASDIARSHGGTLTLGQSKAHGGLQADLVIAR